jgi:hypothetical protein
MRKKLTLGVWLVAIMLAIVGPPFAMWSMRPYEPPLRVGMDQEEVHQLLGAPDGSGPMGKGLWDWPQDVYCSGSDWLGNRRILVVTYKAVHPGGEKFKVERWGYMRPLSTPTWLDLIGEWFGWKANQGSGPDVQ